jgi:DNA-binding response OmpR family regulator
LPRACGTSSEFLAAGATEYISKPVDVDRLLAVLRAGLQR